jgi:hypothetical protein
MSKWLYQYWLFSFSTCKYWGQGPRHWTAHDLLFEEYDTTEFRSSANTPAAIEHQVGLDGGESEDTQPSRFCRYAIHVVHNVDDSIESHGGGADLDEGWPAAWTEPPIEERLRDGLENNDFSNVAKETLPLCIPSIVQATVKSPGELLEESFSFAVMARNQELVATIMRRARDAEIELSSTYPLHIATSYLDGGKNCCNILDTILQARLSSGWGSAAKLNVNEHQHTVLDNLMLTILKGHSRTPLEEVDQSLRREARFAGCEVDLCGRWDADSHCYRALLQRGRTEIPFRWKHKFCHTSTQAVVHCILSLDHHGALLTHPSGLFVRRCMNEDCGLKLQLGPLHALTLATFHLAEDGCDEEDLFGMIAVLLCLLRCFLSASDKAHISMDAILKREDEGTCSHEDLTPFELSQKLPQEVAGLWGTQKQQGWRIFCHVLRIAQETEYGQSEAEENAPWDSDWMIDVPFEEKLVCDGQFGFERCQEDECCFPYADDLGVRCFGRSSKLGHVWAAVQAELLTHRRQHEHEPWVSPRFDMARLLECLDKGAPISMPMIDDGLMKAYCRCGVFGQAAHKIALREMAANDWFGNLDIWDRSTFIDVPPRLEEIFYE